MEAVWEGSGDGPAVREGPGVHNVRISSEMVCALLSPLFDRLNLHNNYLSSIPDFIGRLSNLTEYGVQFAI